MAEYFGHEIAIATQRRLRAMHPEIARTPYLANGGRVLNVLDPDEFGWGNIADYVQENRMIGLTLVPRVETRAKARALFGDAADLPFWQAFTGTPDAVLPPCAAIIDSFQLPESWSLHSTTYPDDALIDEVQTLCSANGVAPTPTYYLRGEAVPSLTTCLWDDTGALAGCANSTMRFHDHSKLAHALFAGGVAVSEAHRRKGLGSVINATLLRDAHAEFGWQSVIEQARNTNLASCGMIRKCGLSEDPDRVTILINLSGAYLTR